MPLNAWRAWKQQPYRRDRPSERGPAAPGEWHVGKADAEVLGAVQKASQRRLEARKWVCHSHTPKYIGRSLPRSVWGTERAGENLRCVNKDQFVGLDWPKDCRCPLEASWKREESHPDAQRIRLGYNRPIIGQLRGFRKSTERSGKEQICHSGFN